MKEHPSYQLQEIIFDLTEISASDILVNADGTKSTVVVVPQLEWNAVYPMDARWNVIIKTAIQNKRLTDTSTLCLAVNCIEWEHKGTTVKTPLFLFPAHFKLNKITKALHIAIDPEVYFLNPFLKNELKRSYDLIWEPDPQLDISQLSNAFYDYLKLYQLPFSPHSQLAFGNFHHHRFQIVKDLELLQQIALNPLTATLLGNVAENTAKNIVFTKENIVPADKDQLAVFEEIQRGNTVIQGPPGTGKSQVLTNILGKLLYRGKMNLVVSEKKAALEVLVKKLKVHGLDQFAFLVHNQTKPGDFITRLKATWQYLESEVFHQSTNLLLSEQLLDQLQLTLDKLSSKKLIGGVPLSVFKQLRQKHDLSDLRYASDVPTVAEWLQHQPAVAVLEKELSSFGVLKHLKRNALQQLPQLDQQLSALQNNFKLLSALLDFEDTNTLAIRIQQAARCQLIDGESYKKYVRIYSKPALRKKFEKLRIAFLKQSQALAVLENEMQLWISEPTLSEVQSWKLHLEGNWLKRRKTMHQMREKLKNNAVNIHVVLENGLHFLEAKAELHHTVSALIELGIERPVLELESATYIFHQLDQTDVNELNTVIALPLSLRETLIAKSRDLQHFSRQLHQLFQLEDNVSIAGIIDNIQLHLAEILLHQQVLIQLETSVFNWLQKLDSCTAIEAQVLYSNWVQFESILPELAQLDGEKLNNSINRIIELQQEESLTFVNNIKAGIKEKFNKYHHLLRTPSTQLDAEEKALKSILKKGKALLVKAFARSRQHQTIRELLDSEARPWIELLIPVWLSTPTQVAANFPMEDHLFETVIFDEASQIPLAHALGALQRSGLAIVAGDEQQMSPGSYFSSSFQGVNLLHQASYHWKKTALKHHYRSIHPDLIAFSNQHFYHNELLAYPSAGHSSTPVQLHFVPDGKFIERENIPEAIAIAQKIENSIETASNIGIVAFSEQQLNCIWNQLSPKVQQQLNDQITAGHGFFRTLEQVQGDECDHLFISLGYGKNENGEFQLRFGPLNQKNGAKRLNVLLTRARISIDFFTSVKATDFSISTNESVNLLRLFLMQHEQSAIEKPLVFPFGLKPVIEQQTLTFENISDTLPDAQELLTLHEVLTQRGWQVRYKI